MLTVSTGDLYPTVAGLAYCAVVGICMGLLDVPRAQEWTSVLSDWCDAETGLVPFRGSCLVHSCARGTSSRPMQIPITAQYASPATVG